MPPVLSAFTGLRPPAHKCAGGSNALPRQTSSFTGDGRRLHRARRRPRRNELCGDRAAEEQRRPEPAQAKRRHKGESESERDHLAEGGGQRSEERRVGKEGGRQKK